MYVHTHVKNLKIQENVCYHNTRGKELISPDFTRLSLTR